MKSANCWCQTGLHQRRGASFVSLGDLRSGGAQIQTSPGRYPGERITGEIMQIRPCIEECSVRICTVQCSSINNLNNKYRVLSMLCSVTWGVASYTKRCVTRRTIILCLFYYTNSKLINSENTQGRVSNAVPGNFDLIKTSFNKGDAR